MKMANQRLTGLLRSQIADSIVSMTFKSRTEAFQKRENLVANKVLDDYIGAANMKLMSQLPPEYFCSRDCVSLSLKNRGYRLSFAASRRVPAIAQYGQVELLATSDLWPEIIAVDAERDNIDMECRELREQANILLAGVSNVKRLLEIWPEVEPYLPKFAEIANLPAACAQAINKMISLAGG
jgi:hypothetical protein